MDWTGYPKNLPPDAPVANNTDLALFLTDPGAEADATFVAELLDLISTAETQATQGRLNRLALAFPREVVAWFTVVAYTPGPPTAAQLVDALSVVPDAPPEVDVELVPLQINRIQITRQPDTRAAVSFMHRLGPGQPWTISQWFVPAPAVDVDPVLLGQNTGAVLSIRLTHEDSQ